MPLFQYSSVGPDGKKASGMINADTLEVAREQLQKQKIFVTQIKAFSSKKNKPPLTPLALSTITRDLALLLKSGLPLYESLVTLEEKYKSHKAHYLFLDLCDQVKGGTKLSVALKAYPSTFDPIYIAMVAAGEESGSLESVFLELSDLIGRQEKLKKRLISAMIYPAFLFAFCLVILSALLFFLIPSMQELYEGRSLHFMTRTVLSTSQFLNQHVASIGIGAGFLLLAIILLFKGKWGKKMGKQIVLKIPLLKRIVKESVLLRFSRVFSLLLSHGIPLLQALSLSKKAMHHPQFETVITQAEQKIVEGQRLSTQVKKSPLFPSLFVRMLGVSEEAGNISAMLAHIANIYQEDLDQSLARFMSLLQPIMLFFLGVIIGGILLAVLLPLTDVSSFLH